MAAQSTYTPIATITLASNTDIFFHSIPQTYTDLILVLQGRSTTSAINAGTYFGFNSTYGTSGFSITELYADGASVATSRQTNQIYFGGINPVPGASSTSTVFGNNHYYLPNYTNTSTYKTVLWKSAGDLNGSGRSTVGVGLWRYTAAVTDWYITSAGSFTTGTIATLYGITAA
jgi:hypothetical protein